jgi:glycosyltransferase involved in cell wall biosynthesis
MNSTSPDFTNTPISPKRPGFDYSLANLSVLPSVTIITPFYDTGVIFHETARSVLQQSFQQWEWLIINDGSTDREALSILEVYRERDPRIRVIDHSANQGLSAARNTGFREARASYVVQLDSDDLLEPTAVEKWYWFLESYPEFGFCKGYSVGFGAEKYLWTQGFHDAEAFLDYNRVDPTSMVRKAVHTHMGGYDESNRDGLEDWEFWLRCASFGHWGGTIPEYLNWYRRRPAHADRWKNWDKGQREHGFKARLRERYPQLWDGGFPKVRLRWHMLNDVISDVLPCGNVLAKGKRRLLIIVPWLAMGGADKFNLDLLEQFRKQGWEVTIATTLQGDDSWFPEFARYTPDIFILHHFLRLVDYPRFLRYLIQSRQVDAVLISNSELGYLLLPYLRAHFANVAFVDFCHIEEERWRNGGYPRMAVEYQELIDMNIVSSEHLKRWMIQRGAGADRIRVCYSNVDSENWRPDPQRRAITRRELGVKESVPLILYACRICPQKQPRVFAATVRRLRRQSLSFVALVAGDGPDLDWLRTFLIKHKLTEDVRVLGAVSIERMQQVMAAADLFFLPSQQEGIALSIYEAMASGLPVVGADVGGQRELVTPDCGVLIARSDEETEAARYAQILAELLRDSQRRAEMGHAGRMRVSTHFRLEQMGKTMVALLQQAIALHETQSRSIPGLGLARTCAAQAVEYVRLTQLADSPWNERYRPHGIRSVSRNIDWRAIAYVVLRWLYEPFYRRGVRRGGAWYFTVANRVKQFLLSPRL